MNHELPFLARHLFGSKGIHESIREATSTDQVKHLIQVTNQREHSSAERMKALELSHAAIFRKTT